MGKPTLFVPREWPCAAGPTADDSTDLLQRLLIDTHPGVGALRLPSCTSNTCKQLSSPAQCDLQSLSLQRFVDVSVAFEVSKEMARAEAL